MKETDYYKHQMAKCKIDFYNLSTFILESELEAGHVGLEKEVYLLPSSLMKYVLEDKLSKSIECVKM